MVNPPKRNAPPAKEPPPTKGKGGKPSRVSRTEDSLSDSLIEAVRDATDELQAASGGLEASDDSAGAPSASAREIPVELLKRRTEMRTKERDEAQKERDAAQKERDEAKRKAEELERKIAELEAQAKTQLTFSYHIIFYIIVLIFIHFHVQDRTAFPKQKSRTAGKRRRSASPPAPSSAPSSAESGRLNSMCNHSFLRRVTPLLIPELISRLGNKWHGAHNRSIAANMLRHVVLAEDIDQMGSSGLYDRLASAYPKEERMVLTRILRTGQHAARKHRLNLAALVRALFEQTPPSEADMLYIKETVFGVKEGAPIMASNHPAIVELFSVYTGVSLHPLPHSTLV